MNVENTTTTTGEPRTDMTTETTTTTTTAAGPTRREQLMATAAGYLTDASRALRTASVMLAAAGETGTGSAQRGALKLAGQTDVLHERLTATMTTAGGTTAAPSTTVIAYTRDLDIRNLDQLARGTGAAYLECTRGPGETLIAACWRRRLVPLPPERVMVAFDSAIVRLAERVFSDDVCGRCRKGIGVAHVDGSSLGMVCDDGQPSASDRVYPYGGGPLMPRLVSGRDLSPSVRREVLAAFVYRWTVDNPHRAAAYGTCPTCGVPGGAPAALDDASRLGCRQRHPVIPFQTDEQWLAGHAFYVTRDGRLAARPRDAVPLAAAETATATPPAGRFLHGISESTFDRLALFANPPGHLVGRAALPDVWVSDRVADRLEQYRGPGMTDDQMLNAAIDAAFGTDPRP